MNYFMYIFVALIFPVVSVCQSITESLQDDQAYRKFKEQFEKEIDRFGKDSTLPADFVIHPVSTPDWLVNFPQAKGNKMLAVGFSDPGMDEDQARELAVFRAKTVAALLLNPALQTVSEFYTGDALHGNDESLTGKYVNFFRIMSAIPANVECFKEIHYDFNDFREAMVILEYHPCNRDDDTVFSVANVYQAERRSGEILSMEEKVELFALIKSEGEQPGKHQYIIHTVNNKNEISSKYKTNDISFPYRNYKYSSRSNQSVEHNHTPVKLHNGLWKAFLESLLHEIYLNSQTGPVNVQQVGDAHSSVRKNISRETAVATRTYRIDKIAVMDNKMSVGIKTLNHK